MTEMRWTKVPFDSDGLFPDVIGKRRRITIGPDDQVETIEVEVPRLPTESGWYRLPKVFGAVFLRDDGAWLDANGHRVDTGTLPDGLIRLVDASA